MDAQMLTENKTTQYKYNVLHLQTWWTRQPYEE